MGPRRKRCLNKACPNCRPPFDFEDLLTKLSVGVIVLVILYASVYRILHTY